MYIHLTYNPHTASTQRNRMMSTVWEFQAFTLFKYIYKYVQTQSAFQTFELQTTNQNKSLV